VSATVSARPCVAPPAGTLPSADKITELSRIAGLRSRDVADAVVLLVEDLAKAQNDLTAIELANDVLSGALQEESAELDAIGKLLGAKSSGGDLLEQVRFLVDVKERARKLARVIAGEMILLPSHQAVARERARELFDAGECALCGALVERRTLCGIDCPRIGEHRWSGRRGQWSVSVSMLTMRSSLAELAELPDERGKFYCYVELRGETVGSATEDTVELAAAVAHERANAWFAKARDAAPLARLSDAEHELLRTRVGEP
jgi:hypothetical protein